jgi:hypothetical protein
MDVLVFPEAREVRNLLEGLLGRDVKVTTEGVAAPVLHEVTMCGLVDDENVLRYVFGTDLALAHFLGAAVALIPAGRAKEARSPDEDLVANYREVANVLSRSVNERAENRVRIDPGLALDRQAMVDAVSGASTLARYAVDVAGYGEGVLVIAVV